jgi:hypothetical protein
VSPPQCHFSPNGQRGRNWTRLLPDDLKVKFGPSTASAQFLEKPRPGTILGASALNYGFNGA